MHPWVRKEEVLEQARKELEAFNIYVPRVKPKLDRSDLKAKIFKYRGNKS